MNSGTRIAISNACAAIGVSLLLLSGAWPADWYPIVPLLLGLALVAVSHVLTPCQDQITKWWRRVIHRMP